MRRSGYGPRIRQDIILGVLSRDKELREWQQPRYRTKEQILKAKGENQHRFVNTWFLKGQYTSVLKVQATPGGSLLKETRDKVGELKAPDGGLTKVVEAAGASITAGLRNPDPCWPKGCPFKEQCPVEPTQSCGGSRVVYQLQCTNCEASYLGTSGHSLHKRGMEHLTAVRRRNQSYAMARHYSAEHPDWDPNSNDLPFTSKMLKGPNIQGNLQRYLSEALLIRDFTDSGKKLLNGRGEWGRTSLKRLAIVDE